MEVAGALALLKALLLETASYGCDRLPARTPCTIGSLRFNRFNSAAPWNK